MNTDKKIQNFKILLEHIKKRPGMYVQGGEYALLVSFIDGYLVCFKEFSDIDLSNDFRDWVHQKYKHFAIHEAWYIHKYVANENPELATTKLFEHWNEFLNTYNPTK
jgi:hypothetical protein